MTETTNRMFIDYDKAKELLQKAVDESPNKVVNQCTYFLGDEPNCIVGKALSYVGLVREDVNFLAEGDDPDAYPYPANESKFEYVKDGLEKFVFTDDASALLGSVQYEQDFGYTWRGAFEFAVEEIVQTRISDEQTVVDTAH